MPATTASSSRQRQPSKGGAVAVLPVLICPPSEGRYWPLSRSDFPDIFVPVQGDLSAFDLACMVAKEAGAGRMFVSIEETHRFLASEAAEKHGLSATIVLASSGLGTLDAACLVALIALRSDAEAMLTLVPVGPLHADPQAIGRKARDAAGSRATAVLSSGGVSVVRSSVLLDLAAEAAPDVAKRCREAVAEERVDPPFVRPGRITPKEPALTLDALLARHAAPAPDRSPAPVTPAIDAIAARDAGQSAELVGCTNTVVHSPHRLTVAVGLDDVVIVDTPDALLVARREALDPAEVARRIAGRPERAAHRRVLRPWGAFEGIDRGPGHQVKHITVKPGAALSLQYHHHRAEHWIVVRGTARVTCGDRTFVLHENESTFIPMGAVHRLENPGKIPLEIIEVQSGSYLGEDDIVRIEDVYGRTDGST